MWTISPLFPFRPPEGVACTELAVLELLRDRSQAREAQPRTRIQTKSTTKDPMNRSIKMGTKYTMYSLKLRNRCSRRRAFQAKIAEAFEGKRKRAPCCSFEGEGHILSERGHLTNVLESYTFQKELLIFWVNEWVSDWLTDWVTDWVSDRVTEWVTDWVID